MRYKIVYTTRQPQVLLRQREVTLTESELQILLDRVGALYFDNPPTAGELMDYGDCRGQFALRIDIAAEHEQVRRLLEGIAEQAHWAQAVTPVVAHRVIKDHDEEQFSVVSTRRIA